MNKKFFICVGVVCVVLLLALQYSSQDVSRFFKTVAHIKQAQDVSLIIEKLDLEEQEKLGGHTIEKHIAKSTAWLQDRSAMPFFANKHIIPSSFVDKESATTYIKEVMGANRSAIEVWLADNKKIGMKSFERDFAKIIGFGVDKDGKKVDFTKVRVLLKKSNDGGFYLATAYPS